MSRRSRSGVLVGKKSSFAGGAGQVSLLAGALLVFGWSELGLLGACEGGARQGATWTRPGPAQARSQGSAVEAPEQALYSATCVVVLWLL